QAMLALHKILLGQKRVNNNTQDTDKARRAYTKAKVKRVTKKIANSQGEVRENTLGLADGVSGLELDTDILDRAAVLMNASRVALEATDTSEETRVVQRQIMALLEHLVSDMDEGMMGMGPPGASGSAMAGMMMNGMSGQGYFGGDNAEVPLTQVYLGKQDWKDIRSEYEGKIVGGWEEVVAPEFRGLLETYFDALRGDTFPLEGE
ncbi:MAG: hypothetical protein QF662_03825, partial [Phycisphaerae bacterium]|nr:hypothetical protein [Phycisphaerae bacterium]